MVVVAMLAMMVGTATAAFAKGSDNDHGSSYNQDGNSSYEHKGDDDGSVWQPPCWDWYCGGDDDGPVWQPPCWDSYYCFGGDDDD
jgi:hypothetical protein